MISNSKQIQIQLNSWFQEINYDYGGKDINSDLSQFHLNRNCNILSLIRSTSSPQYMFIVITVWLYYMPHGLVSLKDE